MKRRGLGFERERGAGEDERDGERKPHQYWPTKRGNPLFGHLPINAESFFLSLREIVVNAILFHDYSIDNSSFEPRWIKRVQFQESRAPR
jgi:hypothetical protein